MDVHGFPFILIVEDDKRLLQMYEEVLSDTVTVYTADSLESALQLFGAYRTQLEMIFIDGCVPGKVYNTRPFVKAVLEHGFKAPLIGISSDYQVQTYQRKDGCTDICEKDEVVRYVLRYFVPQSERFPSGKHKSSVPVPV